jgi:hypothetical protein
MVDEEEATRHFDPNVEEPTTFLPVEEKTQYLTDETFADAVAAAANDPDPEASEADEEELTHIFFNLEEGIGVPELVNEPAVADAPVPPLPAGINDPPQLLDVEAEIVAQNDAAFPPGPRRSTPSAIRNKSPRRAMSEEVANWMKSQTQTERRNVETLELRRTKRSDQLSTILLVVGVVMLLLAVAGLITKTPVGVKLGLRKPSVASIEVRTTPAVGAAVKLDGIFRGRAPLRLEGVRSGRRVIAVSAEGYQEAARSVDLAGGNRAQLLIELQPLRH